MTMLPFAGLSPELETFIERIDLGPGAHSDKARSNRGGNMSGEVVDALDRWKQLEREGWDVEALVADDGSTMVGLGCRYAHAFANAAGAPASA